MNEKVENLKGKLIVSCQALPREPLHSSFIMGRMALAAKEGRAYGIHASTKEDTTGVQARVDLPVIDIMKRDYGDSKVYITPTVKEINELMKVKPDIITLDAAHNLRPGSKTLDEFYGEIRKSYPGWLLMTDCSTVEEALHVDQLGFDFIGTTLVGYADRSRNLRVESNDFEIIRQTATEVKHRIITEGSINTPEKVKRVTELGAFSVVVGSIITRPQLITKSFTKALNQYKHVNHFIIKGTQRVIERKSRIAANLEKYKDVIPTFYACYDAEGNMSPERVRVLTEYYIREGVRGVYVNESSGECIYQSLEDCKITLESVMAAAKGRLTVIAHVGCSNTKNSMELAKHTESLGVDAIASIPPVYFHLPEYAIAAYWGIMSQAAPNTDFIIYNIPQLADVALTQSLFAEMRKNLRVIGVKNPSIPVQDIQMFKLTGGDDCTVFNDPDEQLIGGHVIGAEAGIGGTYGVMPELFLKVGELVKAGKMEEAVKVQYAASDIIYRMCSGYDNMYDMIKEILRISGSLDLDEIREPLPQLIESDLAIAQEAARMVKGTVAAYC